MALPTIESIKTMVESHYDTYIHDVKLVGYKPIPGLLGPMFYPGGFGVVFPLVNSSGKKYAFRVWHKEIPGIKERTNKIASYLKGLNLPYFVEFDYVSAGLTVEEDSGNQIVDTVRMDWIEGKNLHEYLSNLKESESLENFKKKMLSLAMKFKEMFKVLHNARISHGDLQHGNIVIMPDQSIKLVDYDSVFVPTIQGEKQITSGLTGYQHPKRKNTCELAADYDDYFSELIIYSGILILAICPELWPEDEDEIDNFSLLFTEKDFQNIRNSSLYNKVMSFSSTDAAEDKTIAEIQKLMRLLDEYLQTSNLSSLKPIPGTERSKKKKIYESPAEDIDIDVVVIKKDLEALGGGRRYKKEKGYSSVNTQKANIHIEKIDLDSKKEKYRNQ